MDIQVLGAHNCEAKDFRCVSLLIDDILAIDAGSLAPSLPFSAQKKLKAIHTNPYLETEIEAEIAQISKELNVSITLAHEGMRIHL